MRVIIKIMGGLASQMHKYAIGRAIADGCNGDLMLDLSWFDGAINKDTKREFQLDKFKTSYLIADNKQIEQLKSSLTRQKIATAARKIGAKKNLLKKSHYVKGIDSRDILTLNPPIYVEGEWFGATHIEHIKKILIEDFQLKNPLRENHQALIKSILNTESVAIHIRRGDYISNPLAAKFHYLTGIQYYQSAIEHCYLHLNNPVFFLFSDDPIWVTNNFSNERGNFITVQGNQPFEDLALMKSCKHQIICNSGFGWFGAWLNNSESKLNIAPRLWVKDHNLNQQIISDLQRSSMILI